jgi:hypothetical protein
MEMKNAARMTLLTLALVLAAFAPAYAQKSSLTVNIPFAFSVDGVTMPAGEYVVSAPSERTVAFQHIGGTEARTSLTNNSGPVSNGRSEVVFHRYGSAYFLAAVRLPNSDHAREFFASANEIQVARNGGQDVVELALLTK